MNDLPIHQFYVNRICDKYFNKLLKSLKFILIIHTFQTLSILTISVYLNTPIIYLISIILTIWVFMYTSKQQKNLHNKLKILTKIRSGEILKCYQNSNI